MCRYIQDKPETSVDELLKHGADVSSINSNLMTPLYWAAISANGSECLKLLLKAGANVDHRDSAQVTPLMRAMKAGMTQNAKVLLEHRADPNSTDKSHWTPLDFAISQNQHDAITLMLQNGADYSFNRSFRAFMHLVARRADITTLEILTSASSKIRGEIDPEDRSSSFGGMTLTEVADGREESVEWYKAFQDLVDSTRKYEVAIQTPENKLWELNLTLFQPGN